MSCPPPRPDYVDNAPICSSECTYLHGEQNHTCKYDARARWVTPGSGGCVPVTRATIRALRNARLKPLNPPNEFAEWSLRYDTTADLWSAIPRGDWAMWLLARCGYDRRKLAGLGLVMLPGAYALPPAGDALVANVRQWLAGTAGSYDWAAWAELYRVGDPCSACPPESALAAFLAAEHDPHRAATWLARVSQYVALSYAEPAWIGQQLGAHARLIREQIPAADALAALEGSTGWVWTWGSSTTATAAHKKGGTR